MTRTRDEQATRLAPEGKLTRTAGSTALWVLGGLAPVARPLDQRKLIADDKSSIRLSRNWTDMLRWLLRSGVWGAVILTVAVIIALLLAVGFWLAWPHVAPQFTAFYEWLDVAIPTVLDWFEDVLEAGVDWVIDPLHEGLHAAKAIRIGGTK